MSKAMLPPGAVIGMLGGGQLGRMTALAAARLGYRTHVFCPDADSPCGQVTDRATLSSYGDHAALEVFARAVDVVTFEFENIPHDTVAFLAERVPVRPGPRVLAVCQDRLAEKDFVSGLGIATAPYRSVPDPAALTAAVGAIAPPAVLKAARFGYDGKAQALIDGLDAAPEAWQRVGARTSILEGFIDFAGELSVIAARGLDGAVACYPPVANVHREHILWQTTAPADLPPETAAEAEAIARRLAEALDVVGLLAVEMFLTKDGRLLVNELAPRPHNSGHWTIDACATSQFEQFVRAICGLPLGATDRLTDAVMTNLLGDDVDRWPELLAEPGARLHLYGKVEARPGRKMGHVTRLRRRGGQAVRMGLGLGVAFAYLAVMKLTEPFGYEGELSPLLAAWLPHLLFAAGALFAVVTTVNTSLLVASRTVMRAGRDGVFPEAEETAEAAAAHKETAHYLEWRERVQDMMAEPRRGEPFNGLFPKA